MKVLAINGSPKGKNGNTEVLLEQFLEGCREVGCQSETVYLNSKNINHCTGCFSCWTKTPGKCIYNDDMEELLNKIVAADIMVYATPLYYYTVTGLMKDFMDRMLPLNKGNLVNVDGQYSHPKRYKKNSSKVVVISNCGFPDRSNFSGLIETFKVMTKGTINASILCAQGGILNSIKSNYELTQMYAPFFEALRNAGKEVVELGHIKEETQKIIDNDVINTEVYLNNANKNWEKEAI